MMSPFHLIRLIKINRTLLRFGLNRSVIRKDSRSLRFLSYLNPWSFTAPPSGRGDSLCVMLERLGPVFVKFGQMLSTRRDILPEDIADALTKLQDSVSPFPGKQALDIVAKELDRPLSEVFSEIDEKPLAAASIAQVHTAKTIAGDEVILKILRPNLYKIIRQDLSLMYSGARLMQKVWKKAARFNLLGLIQEFERTIVGELDLMREAANASQLRRNFEDDKKLYVPKVYWEYTTSRVMCMERIHGIRISHIDELKAAGTDLHRLAANGVEIFFTQVLRDSFFHADMHPGNLFVDVKDPKKPVYLGVDFGIMGTLSPDDQFYLAKNLLAFFRRDYRRVAKLHVECGWVPADTRVDQFESAIRAVSEPIFQRQLGDISFAQLLLRLFQTAEQFKMKLQPQLLLLHKTLLNIEGLGRQLYPELDLWATAHPILEKWLREQHSFKEMGKQVIRDFPTMLEKSITTPELIHDALHHLVQAQMQHKNMPAGSTKTNKRSYPGKGWVGFGIGLIGSSIFFHLHPLVTNHLMWLGAGLGAICLIAGVLTRAE
jgi:ubiquinone biosynthesis protein